MTYYKAVGAEIRDDEGTQVAVVVPSNCSMKLARQIAAYAVETLNSVSAKASIANRKKSAEGTKPPC